MPRSSLLDLCASFATVCDLRELAPSTRAVYARELRLWRAWRDASGLPDDVRRISADELRSYFVYLRDAAVPHRANPRRPEAAQRGLSPAARNLRWRVLAAFWTFLSDEGILKHEQRNYFSAGRVPKPKAPTVKRQSVESGHSQH